MDFSCAHPLHVWNVLLKACSKPHIEHSLLIMSSQFTHCHAWKSHEQSNGFNRHTKVQFDVLGFFHIWFVINVVSCMNIEFLSKTMFEKFVQYHELADYTSVKFVGMK